MDEKKYVPNEVFVYSVWFEHHIRIPIYVKPFPEDYSLTDEQMDRQMHEHEDLIQSKYFTKERIEQLKEEFIKKLKYLNN